VSPEGLKAIHQDLDGLGYLPPFAGSKHLRDTELGIKTKFLVEGHFPDDGKPKPVAFPNPAAVSFENAGIRYIQLPALLDLKLASGMTSPSRLKDLADVLEVIKLLGLPREYAANLNPYVREKFEELWQAASSTDADV
jgi:hypothetical protein